MWTKLVKKTIYTREIGFGRAVIGFTNKIKV
jgi:hypothetical protein